MVYRKIPIDFILLDKEPPSEPLGLTAGFNGISLGGVVAAIVVFGLIAMAAWSNHHRHRPPSRATTYTNPVHTNPNWTCWSSLDPYYCK